jgi:hypothetical protein
VTVVFESHILQLIIAAAVVLGGIVFIFIGRRGRRIDDHPLCRRCGYDLTGLPTERDRCPECGADLRPTRAVRRGRRERRRVFVAVGLVLLLPGLAGLVYSGRNAASEIDWQRHKPVWWLLAESSSSVVSRREEALDELRWRLEQGELSDAQIEKIADRALARQANLAEPWVPRWGSFVETAHSQQKLSAEKWRQYAVRAVTLAVRVRPKVRRGDPMPVEFDVLPARASATMTGGIGINALAEFRERDATLNGVRSKHAGSPVWEKITFGATDETRSAFGYGWDSDDATLKQLPAGPQQIDFDIPVSIYDMPVDHPIESPPPSATTVVHLSATFVLLPSETSSVTLVKDQRLRKAVEASLVLGNPGDPQPVAMKRAYESIYMPIRAVKPPVDLAFDLFYRFDGKEVPANAFVTEANDSRASGTSVANLPGFSGKTLDLVFRPNPKLAVDFTFGVQIWGEEIVLHDIPVEPKQSGDQ